ncbi:MAG: alpha/beta hydrolase [Flavobacteriaceae bacterium]|nr:alpha/beta hydrolase [Flavobacteriaceae bacterium]
MKKSILCLSILIGLGCNRQEDRIPEVISQPVVIEDDTWSFKGTQNLLFVPENRNDPESRLLALHYFHFPAKHKSSLPPVVFLGAGPGEPYDIAAFYNGGRAEAWRYELNFVNKNRDVILINQRGNSDAPGLQINNFRYRWKNGGTLDQPLDLALRDKNRRESYARHVASYTAQGIDLKGYDVLHFVDDIEAVRQHLGTDKIALVGNSFASQWALGYIKRYPDHVDRALFSGVEPLDHNYDDPDGIWKVLEQIDHYAQQDPNIAMALPEGGLIAAFTQVMERLETRPVNVTVTDEDGEVFDIVVGADDLRFNLTYPRVRSYAAEIESWPKYIMEMYHGDFRMLGLLSRGRVYNSSAFMTNPLFNNSLGVSKEREALLLKRESRKWLGDLANHYTATREVCPAPVVPQRFRQHVAHDIPMVLIQGDMDMSTPYGNAVFLMDYLENGHLLTVKRGFHNAKRALIFADSLLIDQVYGFMDLEDPKKGFKAYSASIPKQYALPSFEFWPLHGPSLYDRYHSKSD